jgi:small Trp-rich protein
MPFVVVGVLLMLARWLEFGPFANMSWWVALAPFGMAVLWWEFADSSGWTKRRVMDKLEKRKQDRRAQQMESLGISPRRERVMAHSQKAKAVQVSADPTHAGRDAPSKPEDEAGAAIKRDPRF